MLLFIPLLFLRSKNIHTRNRCCRLSQSFLTQTISALKTFLLATMNKFERFRLTRLVPGECLVLFPGMSSRLPIGYLAKGEDNLYTCCYGTVKARTLTTPLATQPRSCGLNPSKARDLTILQNDQTSCETHPARGYQGF
jgi:hypothetical protein